jgi:hypothetical protein
MYCGDGLGATPTTPAIFGALKEAAAARTGGGAFSPAGLAVLGLGPRPVPVLKSGLPNKPKKYCASRGITYYFDTQAQADAFQCPPSTTSTPNTPAAPPVTGGADPGVDYGNPGTYPGPNTPPPSQGTQNQINSIPASGAGGGAPLVEDGAPSVQSAGLLGGVSPLMLAALAVGAIFALRKRR